MAHLWDRRDHRVGLGTSVHVSAWSTWGRGQTIIGEATNLSRSGMFVTANAAPFPVGTMLECDLPLEDQSLTLRGCVAWVRPESGGRCGMGIEFVDLSVLDAHTLRRVVGEPRDDVQQLDVWFEGIPQPMRVEALTTGNRIRLRTTLPFLQLYSTVSYLGTAGEREIHKGTVRHVTLTADPNHPIPCLQVDVDPEQLQTDEALIRDSSGEIEVATLHARKEGPGFVEDVLPPVLLQSDAEAPKPATPPPIPCLALSDELEAHAPGQGAATAAAAEFDAPDVLDTMAAPPELRSGYDDELVVEFGADPFDEVELQPIDEAHHRTGPSEFGSTPNMAADTPIRTYSELAVAPPEATGHEVDDRTFWADTSTSRWRTWIWVAAITMATIAIASTIQTRLWQRLSQSVERWTTAHRAPSVEAPAVAAEQRPKSSVDLAKPKSIPIVDAQNQGRARVLAKPAVAPSSAGPPKLVKAVPRAGSPAHAMTRPKTVARTPAPPTETTMMARRPRNSRTNPARPQVVHVGDATSLTIPITGTLAAADHYPLANPDGLVVKLPHATPGFPYQDYAIHSGGFRVLWVRPNEAGVQLRFLFARPTPEHQLEIAPDHVKVTLREARPAPADPVSSASAAQPK